MKWLQLYINLSLLGIAYEIKKSLKYEKNVELYIKEWMKCDTNRSTILLESPPLLS